MDSMNRCRDIALLLLLRLLCPEPTSADDPTILNPPLGSLYLGPGRMLDAAPPRQMSLNAHITQFLYQPGGLSLAYLSNEANDNDGVTRSVRLVGLKRGETTTLLRHISSADDPGFTSLQLRGWTADARDLIVSADTVVPSADDARTYFRPAIFCVDVGTTPVRIRPLALSLPPPSKDVPFASATVWWPPSRTRLLIEQTGDDRRIKSAERTLLCALYDPAQDKMDTFALPPGEGLRGWTDESHLLLFSHTGGETHFYSWNVATGTQTQTKPPVKMPEREARDSNDVSPKSPALSLDVEQRFHPDKQGVTGINSHLLWLRRAGRPRALSAMPVGLTPGDDDPTAVWSPNGKQIAFLDHGDLFVTDLSERTARAKERYLAGETLSCPEEQQVAAEALKQIGLAIMQYSQDSDEQFPALAGLNGNIRPYLPPDALLAVGGHPFVYHAPSNLSLAAMDAPADTILGTIDLPCGRVALYADGHVKNVLAPPSSGPGP